MLRMFFKFAYQALTCLTFGYFCDMTVALEEFLLSNSVSFGNVLQICIQFYVSRLPLLSFLIHTTPFPPNPSEFLKMFSQFAHTSLDTLLLTLFRVILFALNTS